MTRHDKRWLVLMAAAITVGVFLPYPLDCIQLGACSFSIGVKLGRISR